MTRLSGRGSDALAEAAVAGVPKLAAVSGHPVSGNPAGSAPAGGGEGPAVPLAILVGVCVLLAAAIITWRRRHPSSAGTADMPTRTRRR